MKVLQLLLFSILFLLVACKEEPKEEALPINPEDVVIDIQVGGVPTPDRVLLSFKKMGNGPDTMLIPGSVFLSDDFKVFGDQHTMIFYDVRNRGRSSTVKNPNKLERGIVQDVADMETMRRFFKIQKFSTISHAYLSHVVASYAKKYPQYVEKVIMLSPLPPDMRKSYAVFEDEKTKDFDTQMANLELRKDTLSDIAYCDLWWGLMREKSVVNEEAAIRTFSNICQYPNERPKTMMGAFSRYTLPSIENQPLTSADFENVTAPLLILHGDKDRIASLDGAKAWEKVWPNAKVEVMEGAGHVTWMDKQGLVFNAIRNFLAN
jgi:pimeloyl-ACP methyl ester carboxylesterase